MSKKKRVYKKPTVRLRYRPFRAVRVPARVADALEPLASEQGKSLTSYIADLLEAHAIRRGTLKRESSDS